MKNKVLLVILDGQPWSSARRLNGNLEGWVQSGAARVWKIRSVLPSTSASCYAAMHTCTLDSMRHRYGHDCAEMDNACAKMDGILAHFLPLWMEGGYEVAVTADHGQTVRGHHGGREPDQQDVAFYWFGGGTGPDSDELLDQLALAPTLLTRMGPKILSTMKAAPFFDRRIRCRTISP